MNNDSIIKNLNDIFKIRIDYDNINKYNDVKLRNSKIDLYNLFYFAFMNTRKNITQQEIIISLNIKNKENIYYTSYCRKLDNIDSIIFKNILNDLKELHSEIINENNKKYYFYAVDGTYNINKEYEQILNLSIFDVYEQLPIDISKCSTIRNEPLYFKDFINKCKLDEHFKKYIFIGDRLYCSKDLIIFLINNTKFIIRVKKKNIEGLFKNKLIKENVRIVKDIHTIEKEIFIKEDKNNDEKKFEIEIENDYYILTNLKNKRMFSDKKIIELYKKRWEIESYFKLVKSNFKFEQIDKSYEKTYIIIQIITYILKIIKEIYLNTNPKYKDDLKNKNKNNKLLISFNNTQIIKSIYNDLLMKIINGNINNKFIDDIKISVKLFFNKKDRFFIRSSKKPFTKWYVKSYSLSSINKKIINAITNDKINTLHKNLRSIARTIKKINGECVKTFAKSNISI